MHPHTLYELCVQAPDRDVELLRAMHGGSPRILGEDFCGSAALSREWARRVPKGTAIAVDHDRKVLAHAEAAGVTPVLGDVRECTAKADVIFVGNFSIGEFHDRPSLVEYLRHARSRLRPGGLFACDIYGGVDAYETGTLKEQRLGPNGEKVTYTWEQRLADPLTARVTNALHFHVKPKKGAATEYRDAFIYNWRLWSIPELRDALTEAGFGKTQVYHRFAHAVDQDDQVHVRPLEDGEPMEPAYFVFVTGRGAARSGKAGRPSKAGKPRTPAKSGKAAKNGKTARGR